MAAASSSPSSSSVANDGFTYDVFLSFRGIDTRHVFSGSLWKTLEDKGIHTFFDKENLDEGKEITPELRRAIEESRMALVVLSPDYASSEFCLEELSHILDCIRGRGRLVWPIFYEVEPSDLRWLEKGTYKDAMDAYETKSWYNEAKSQKWKNALKQVADLSGTCTYFEQKKGGYLHEIIGKIVKKVSRQIKPFTLAVPDNLVGLELQMEAIGKLLNLGSTDICHMVEVCGIGGIGKTTISVAVFNSIAKQFDCSCFLPNVREDSEKKGLTHLQEKILFDTVGEKKIKLTSDKHGTQIMRQRLRHKKVLLLLDDVDNVEKIDAIVGRPEWFGPGSRVIITTRNAGMVTRHWVKSTHEMNVLKDEHALDLLRSKAFKPDRIGCDEKHISNLLDRAVTIASGLPLALEVIGSHLFKIEIQGWEYAIGQFEKIQHENIQNVLEVSFKALREEEKSAFLDIACCYKGFKLKFLKKILFAHLGDSAKDHLRVLVEKSLIKFDDSNRVTLHDLIVKMGREIVRRESWEHPGERSRLWCTKDVVEVLQEKTGTNKIEIICLDSSTEVIWDGEAFKGTTKLRTLIVKFDCAFSESPKYLPNTLKVFMWDEYPSAYLPSDFYPKKLVLCQLSDNTLHLQDFFPKENKFKSMRYLYLKGDNYLKKIPDISGLPNLEELSFSHCSKLITMDDSVGLLGKLKILNVTRCEVLKIFPSLNLASLEQLDILGCRSLKRFPPEVGGLLDKLKILRAKNCTKLKIFPTLNLASLEELDISGCDGLESFPPVVGGLLDKLKILRAKDCEKLKIFPTLNLASLEELHISGCRSLESFPPVVGGLLDKLKILRAKDCEKLKIFPTLNLASLEQLDISGCDGLESFPPVVGGLLDKLKILRAKDCEKLKIFPTLNLASLEELDISGCRSLESFPPVVGGLLDKLKILRAKDCEKLKIFPTLNLASLEQLDISGCDGLESFPPVVGGLLDKLKILRAKDCEKLKIFPTLNSASLEELHISGCRSLESFPPVVGGLLDKLKILRAKDCEKLKIFPTLNLASLEELHISGCRSLESFPPVVDGLLDKLKILRAKDCETLKIFPTLNLASLEELDISGCRSLESFPPVVDGLLDKLKILRAKDCKKLKIFPTLKLASLENLDISYCESLESFPPILDKLKLLNATECKKLKSFPSLKLASLERLDLSYCESIEIFPAMENEFVGKLKNLNVECCKMLQHLPPLKLPSLRVLNLSRCESLEDFPEILVEMENIETLDLIETPIKELPFSFRNLCGLESLYLAGCGNVQFPSSIVEMSKLAEIEINLGGWVFPKQEEGREKVSSSVKSLRIHNCNLSDESLATGLKWFSNIERLVLSGSNFTTLPQCIENCQFLWKLILNDCEELQELEAIPPSINILSATNCKSLTSSSKSKLLNQELHEARNTFFHLPICDIPEWFDHKCMEGESFSFWFRNKVPGIVLCYVPQMLQRMSKYLFCLRVKVIINGNFDSELNEKFRHLYSDDFLCGGRELQHLLLFHLQLEKIIDNLGKELLENKWIHVKASTHVSFQKSGIHVLKEKSSMDDIRFTKPENDDDDAPSSIDSDVDISMDDIRFTKPENDDDAPSSIDYDVDISMDDIRFTKPENDDDAPSSIDSDVDISMDDIRFTKPENDDDAPSSIDSDVDIRYTYEYGDAPSSIDSDVDIRKKSNDENSDLRGEAVTCLELVKPVESLPSEMTLMTKSEPVEPEETSGSGNSAVEYSIDSVKAVASVSEILLNSDVGTVLLEQSVVLPLEVANLTGETTEDNIYHLADENATTSTLEENQPCITSAPIIIPKTSWWSCCGLFEILSGSDR